MWHPMGLAQLPGLTSDNTFGKRATNAFETGDYSDLTVICGDRKWKVHKVQLSQHSPVFEKMLQGLPKDAKVLELKDDDPDSVNYLLRFMYLFDFEPPRAVLNKLVVEMRTHKIANKYKVPGLAAQAWYRYGITMIVDLPIPVFFAGVHEAYSSEGYEEFRKSFVNRTVSVIEEKRENRGAHKMFWDALEKESEFAIDLLRSEELVRKSRSAAPRQKRGVAPKHLRSDDLDGDDDEDDDEDE